MSTSPSMRGCRIAALACIVCVAGTTTGAWSRERPWLDASLPPEQRTASLLAAMTLPEKLSMLHFGMRCGYIGCVDGNARLGIPALRLQDGAAGVGNGVAGVTQLPAPVVVGASWDTVLARRYGEVLGTEHWAKGVNIALTPTVNIVRDPRWGRAYESFGEDPFLNGRMAVAHIVGVQSRGPMVQLKHFAAYNQETLRSDTNVLVDERTLHEIYLPAFETAIREARPRSVMCSYNMVNNLHACENPALLMRILKGELGYEGFVTSDWFATQSTVAAANSGLDMEMPNQLYFGAPLAAAVAAGRVTQATIDDKVRRILLAMFRQRLFERPQNGTLQTPATRPDHVELARQVAVQGSVLLKNDGALPLPDTVRSIAVIGPRAGTSALTGGGGSAQVQPSELVSPYQGLQARAGDAVEVRHAPALARSDGALPGIDPRFVATVSGRGPGFDVDYFAGTQLAPPVLLNRVDAALDHDWQGGSPALGVPPLNWSARWTALLTPPDTGTYTFSLSSDDGSRLLVNGQPVIDSFVPQPGSTRSGTVALAAGEPVLLQVEYFQGGGGSRLTLGWLRPGQNLHDEALEAARTADAAVVVVGKPTIEGSDLADIRLPADQDALVASVAALNRRTIVVVNTGSAVAMPWLASVAAVVQGWYPGQAYGHALAALLFGDENFSGKLPVSFPRALADAPAATPERFPGVARRAHYDEGLEVGYRWYDRRGIEPMFPFGHGLSYTSFAYGNLAVGAPDAAGSVTVSFDVTNTGGRSGAEVAQVYVGQPATSGEPLRQLRGFERLVLRPQETRRASITLDRRSFQSWQEGGWVTTPGVHQVFVGASSRDVRLSGQVMLP